MLNKTLNDNFSKPILATVFCYQVNYMNKDVHKYTLIEWTDKHIRFKWKQEDDGKWHKGTQYHDNLNYKWFKTKKEATYFVSNSYDEFFIHPRQNKC